MTSSLCHYRPVAGAGMIRSGNRLNSDACMIFFLLTYQQILHASVMGNLRFLRGSRAPPSPVITYVSGDLPRMRGRSLRASIITGPSSLLLIASINFEDPWNYPSFVKVTRNDDSLISSFRQSIKKRIRFEKNTRGKNVYAIYAFLHFPVENNMVSIRTVDAARHCAQSVDDRIPMYHFTDRQLCN